MPSTYTTRNRLEKQAPGENDDTWGTRLNEKTTDMVDAALDGVAGFTLSGSKTLTDEDGAADESRMRVLNITGGTGGTITIPDLEKWYWVRNASSGNVVITTGSGTTAKVPAGTSYAVVSVGSNTVYRMGQRRRPRLTGANTTLTPADDGRTVRSTQSSQLDFTIQPEATEAWDDGARVECFGGNNGSIRILQGSGVTLNWNGNTGTRTVAAGNRVVLERNGSNDWFITGSGIT